MYLESIFKKFVKNLINELEKSHSEKTKKAKTRGCGCGGSKVTQIVDKKKEELEKNLFKE
tara:strand:- start:239 stop:418 length:180 start_codon:yes stop_codon:yes gene_type:complete